MRPLTLHSSALNHSEYSLYISCIRDLSEDSEDDPAFIKHDDSFYDNFKVGVREARAWLRGRYPNLAPSMIDSILRLFCPSLSQTDVLNGGQVFAVLRLIHHALSGKAVDKGLVFVQAYPESESSGSNTPSAKPHSSNTTSNLSSPDVNPFSQMANSERPLPTGSSVSAPPPPPPNGPPAVPPKPSTNPFVARRGSEESRRPPIPFERTLSANARARSAASVEGRTPPLPPRKPTGSLNPPPRHSTQALHAIPSASSTNPNVLIQQSLQATRVAQSLKRAEQRLEQERVLEVLKSSSSVGTRRPRSISPLRDQYTSSPSNASSVERAESGLLPALPPRPKVSPPTSVLSGSTSRSLEQVARASVPYKPPLRSAPSAVFENRSPTHTPPRPLTELPPDPPPTHPDRKLTLVGLDSAERSFPPSPDSPRVFRSKSMHHPSPPPIPLHKKRRPESVQLTPTSSGAEPPFSSPSYPQFPSSVSHQPSLSRHHSVSSSFSGRSYRSDGSALSEPIANLQKTLTNLHQKAQPHFDSARYKAEAAFNPRGFVQHSQPSTRWTSQEGEERLISDDDDGGEGKDDSESQIQDVEESDGEKDWNERLRRLKMGEGLDDHQADSNRLGLERDDLKWPVGEGWKRL